MKKNVNSKFVTQYAVREEIVSAYVRKMDFFTKDGHGEMMLLEVYPGVQVWSIDFQMPELNIEPIGPYHFLKLNYCLSGGCKVLLPDERCACVEEGYLSVDINPPVGRMSLPSGKYAGLEIVIDTKRIRAEPPHAWTECGVDILAGVERLSQTQGSYLARLSPELDCLARELTAHIDAGNISLEDYRFLLLRFLWLLKTRQQKEAPDGSRFLTQGQREIVMRVEKRLTHDLRKRYAIGDLASEMGISPTSLKKYFLQAYGKPISVYLREIRMEKAMELLSGSALSIADVASEVGYENQGKFGAVFRREIGFTPLEYRRIHRSTIIKKGRNA